ncbi:Matrix-remodeling-associated protein 5 [Mesitornis unicolor]|uniref:Matrix-remodeling-associated protein 5 n=1 Tax=Mesitornis unicolor TaxID=54374 RepID=A0A091RW85_9AVES|nr:PREDICTED: matrix-remodeling-associated protein 5 isoform X1 [Mesitornis unicolor]KFQ32672.1 Matrix-remodeling-associated protein 5 [Mesitornis unicolor]
MGERAAAGALSVVLILGLGLPPSALACPHPCACYLPTEVHCTFRSLAAVPARMSKHVERINFGFNSIQSIDENSFAGLTKLELLMIHGNDIQNIPNGALKDLVSLQVFKISYNKLKVIAGQTLQGLSSLMRLHMDHNRIEFIHPNAFNGLTSLRLVHLEGNLLHQLHPSTFTTFMVLDYFKLSTVRHLYLSENDLRTLPAGMFQGMPLLENLYLHGNPWACDCSLKWLLEWNEVSGGVLKCKKDKAYEGGQLCPKCDSPKQLQKEDIQNLKDISCRKPVIQSSLRQNSSTQGEEDGDSYELPLEDVQSSPWNITLNMTDEHGNVVHLNCEIKKPTDSTKIQWNQIQTQEIDINATIALDFECPMNRENYEKLWKLIAYYSEVPVKLERELMLSKEPKISYRYRQGSDYDALYYTGVKAQILAEPSWVMQPFINIQLNRRQSTGKKVVLSFFTVFSQTIHTKDTRPQRSWVMIEQNQSTRMAQTVVEGSEGQLSCNVKASESPSIQWLFPDGTKLQAPFNQKNSRFSILSSGQLIIKAASYTDGGLFHCIAQVRGDVDIMAYRLLVQPPAMQVADSDVVRVEKNVGDSIILPCNAVAIPEPQLSWILPSSQVLNDLSNSSKGYMLDNGTLLIPKSHVSDSGHYRCVAVNQQGSDQYVVRVTVNKMVSDRSFKRIKIKKRPGSKSLSKTRGRIIDDGEGSGAGEMEELPRRKNHLKDREISFKQKSDQMPEAQIKRGKKGRRKMKIWKNTDRTQDSNVAEGRRVFESRRRINVASKQINPQHWADILAKVRGKNLPRTTTATAISLTTALPSVMQKTTPVPHPIASPPPSETAANVIDSSADSSPVGEDEPFSVTVSQNTFSVQSMLTSSETEQFSNHKALETPTRTYSVESSVSGPYFTLVSATVQPQGQQHLDVRTDDSVVVKEYIHALTEEPLTEQIVTNFPNINSSSFTVENEDKTLSSTSEENSAFSELPLGATVLAESQTVDLHSILETSVKINEMDMTSVDIIVLTPSQLDEVIPTDSVGTTTISSSISPFVTEKSSDLRHQHKEISTGQTKVADLGMSFPAVAPIRVQSKEELETHRNKVTQESMSSSYAESFQGGVNRNLVTPKPNPAFILHSTNALHKTAEGIKTASSISRLTSVAATTTPYRKTMPSFVTQHARKRPYGRRRLRPNRIRQRPKPFPADVLATEAMPIVPRTPEVEAVTNTSSVTLGSPGLKNSVKIQAKKEEHMEITSSLVTDPVVLEKITKIREVVTTSFFWPTTSPPEAKNVTLSTSPATLVLPVTAPITTLSSDVIRDVVPTKEPSAPVKQELSEVPTYRSLDNISEKFIKADTNTMDSKAKQSSTTASPEYVNSLILTAKTESPEEPILFHSEIVVNETTSGTFQLIYPTMTDLSIPVGTMEVFKDLSVSKKPWKPTISLETPAITEPPQQHKMITLSSSFSMTKTQNFPLRETKKSAASQTGTKSSSLDKKEATSHIFHHDLTLQTTEKPLTTSTAFIPFIKLATLPPSISSTSHPSLHYTTEESNAFNQERFPEKKQVEADGDKMVVNSRWKVHPTPSPSQNRISIQSKEEQFKELYSSKSNNSLLLSPKLPYPSAGMIPSLNQRLSVVPPKYVPVRGTVKPPYIVTQGSFRYFITHQPLHYTNKPEITAYAAHTIQDKKSFASQRDTTTPTQATPFYKINQFTASKFDNQGQNRYNSRFFGNNYVPDNKGTAGRQPSQGIPYYPSSRMPFLFNRTRVFTHLNMHPKPVIPSQLVPKDTNEKKVAQVSPTRITVQKATAIPVPPMLHTTTTTSSPPAAILKITPPAFLSQHTKPQISTTVHAFKYVHHHPQKVPSVSYLGGIVPHNSTVIQSSTNFRIHRERPKIITKGSQSISILAETDVFIPCDAKGEPKPFITWTKVSTGAIMTASTRLQRFEVWKNGTLLIRNVQLQDRGQYLCTAQNLHGIDKMIFLLTVVAHQPKMLLSRYRDVTVYFGETIGMECQASGTPSPHISWIFPDRKILQTVTTTESRIMLHENRTLTIKQATFSDRGVYKCVASNAAGADSIAVRLHIAALPPIIQQDKQENISLPLGSSINIHCTAKAAPSPTIRWVVFDGTQIRPSQFVNGNLFVFPNGTLYIRNVSPKDSGTYECIAANMVGAARRTIQLHVKKHASNAKITGSSPQRTDVTYGSILHLDCSASGDPWPRILWRLPSKRMIDSLHSSLETRIKVFSNGTLVVHSVTDKDAGDYLCVARNKIGDDYVVLKVNVMMKPAKIEHKNEKNHKVKYGGDLKVDCVATGLPNPEISWGLPDGSMINTFMQSDDSGSRTKRYVVFNNGTLYFNDVGLREEGDYTCYAENQIGKDEMKVRVKVVAEPATIKNKTYIIINVPYGDVVTVACEAKGEPTPKVTWLSPTNRPIPALSDKYQVYRDGTLLIQKAQRSDSGNYTCVARNSAGEDRKIVWIHVNVQPPRINGHLSAITSVRETAIRDSRKLIDCKAEGIPSPRVLWAFPEGVILPAPYYGNRITVHRNGTLDIRGVRKTDAVQLICIGRNEGGEARLIVQLLLTDHLEKPSFRDPVNERITAIAGHSINLNCSVQGNPKPSTSWILPNGTEVMSGSRLHRFYHKTDGILHISSLSSGDAGTYRCTARNPGGYVERVVFLKVGLRPEISNQYNNLVSIINGETLQLHCITQANHRAQISWTLPNGMVLDAPQAVGRFSLLENGSLTVREASVFDRGTYLCKVSTEYGTSVMNVPVIVIAYPPRITSEPAPVIYARPGNSVKLNCMAIGIPKAEITWELPDKSHLTTGAQSRLYGNKFLHPQGSLVIQQPSQRDAGFYKCTAKNILGSDSKTTYIHIF